MYYTISNEVFVTNDFNEMHPVNKTFTLYACIVISLNYLFVFNLEIIILMKDHN